MRFTRRKKRQWQWKHNRHSQPPPALGVCGNACERWADSSFLAPCLPGSERRQTIQGLAIWWAGARNDQSSLQRFFTSTWHSVLGGVRFCRVWLFSGCRTPFPTFASFGAYDLRQGETFVSGADMGRPALRLLIVVVMCCPFITVCVCVCHANLFPWLY